MLAEVSPTLPPPWVEPQNKIIEFGILIFLEGQEVNIRGTLKVHLRNTIYFCVNSFCFAKKCLSIDPGRFFYLNPHLLYFYFWKDLPSCMKVSLIQLMFHFPLKLKACSSEIFSSNKNRLLEKRFLWVIWINEICQEKVITQLICPSNRITI